MNSGAGAAEPVTCTLLANRASSMSNDPDACSAMEVRRTWPCVEEAGGDGVDDAIDAVVMDSVVLVDSSLTPRSAIAAASIPGSAARTAPQAFSKASASATVVITGGMRRRIAATWRSISVAGPDVFSLVSEESNAAGAAVGGGTRPGNGEASDTNGPSAGGTPRDAAP
tara:strand:+ start:5393 stop:5899 length:507 start_codon:yes stop_codon:yes gene_type:complete